MADVPPRKSSGLVLLAEDNDDELMLFKRAYNRAKINNPLQIVSTGEQVIAYLKGKGEFSDRKKYPLPVLLLLDLKLPGKDGFQVLRWVREQPAIKRLRVIVLTNSNELRAVTTAYELGANSFITKSPNANEFIEQLKDVKNYWLNASRAPEID